MDLDPYLQLMLEKGGSDLFFSVGARPELKIEGRALPVGREAMTSEHLAAFLAQALDDDQRARFNRDLELNCGLAVPGIGRFRVYVYRQRGEVAMVLRHVKERIPSLEELALPETLQ